MSRAHLEYVRAWATAKLSARDDDANSPFLALRDSLDSVLAGRGSDIEGPAEPAMTLASGWPRLRVGGLTIRSL